eukprot:SAG22_NODE_265_length_13348_cov_150.719149_16_plen_109_part_00
MYSKFCVKSVSKAFAASQVFWVSFCESGADADAGVGMSQVRAVLDFLSSYCMHLVPLGHVLLVGGHVAADEGQLGVVDRQPDRRACGGATTSIAQGAAIAGGGAFEGE